ncbi:MAG: sporulation protein YunB [Syntrophomonadaceae bacterium]|nr:sporulation protein YunB [Syntrophomonadaceae bacterium]
MFGPRINWLPIILLLALFTILSSFLLMDYKLKSSVLEIAKSKAQVSGMASINEIVSKQVVPSIEYKDIVYIHKDNDGRIVLIQPNTLMLNAIMAETVVEVSKDLEKLEENNISIPLGQLSGFRILAGYGPKMKVKIVSAAQVNVKVLNKFEQAGINQTRHLIYFQINSKIRVAVPFLDDEVTVSTTIPLAETIIVGEVPDTFVDFNNTKDILSQLVE